MTASTSIVSGPFCQANGRRGSSRALELALAVERDRAPGLSSISSPARDRAVRRRRRARIRPGASATVDRCDPAPSRTCRPCPPPRGSGCSAPAIADRPTADGLAKVTNSSLNALRPPQGSGADEALAADGHVDERDVGPVADAHLERVSRRRRVLASRPVTTSPVARPATVGLAQVRERRCWCRWRCAQIGMSPQALATTRWVPSPPSTTIAATLALAHRSGGGVASRGRSRPSRRSSSSSSTRASPARRWRCSVVESPSAAGSISDAVDSRRAQSAQQPVDHRGLVGVAEDGCARDQAADVPPGRGIGDDADGRHAHRNPTPRRVAGALRGP